MVHALTDEGLVPSCETPDGVGAGPPLRLLEVARGLDTLGVHVAVESICGEGYAQAFQAIRSARGR